MLGIVNEHDDLPALYLLLSTVPGETRSRAAPPSSTLPFPTGARSSARRCSRGTPRHRWEDNIPADVVEQARANRPCSDLLSALRSMEHLTDWHRLFGLEERVDARPGNSAKRLLTGCRSTQYLAPETRVRFLLTAYPSV